MGRIINLPDDLICHIISFLSAKEATCFKYSSKKWLNLVTIIPNLVLDSDISSNFKDFVDGLSLARHATYRIKRFSLKLRSTDLVNDCLRNVLEHGVLDLELDINVKGNYSLPSEVFTCNSVVELKLGSGFVIDMIPNNALLPALKTLLLDSVRFYDTGGCAFQRLVSACPVLEELVIDGLNWEHWKWSHTVSSLTLKRLTIRREEWEDYEGSEYETLSFNTPSLVYLEYADVLLD